LVGSHCNYKLTSRIHGGSFDSGSASAPGLSEARIANEGNIIVVVPQYRLGVLGYLPPSIAQSAKDPNLGVGDLVLAMRWLRNSARDFGGDGGRVVIGGQSSGAHLIRGKSFLEDGCTRLMNSVMGYTCCSRFLQGCYPSI